MVGCFENHQIDIVIVSSIRVLIEELNALDIFRSGVQRITYISEGQYLAIEEFDRRLLAIRGNPLISSYTVKNLILDVSYIK
jgi:hypothetical protein